MRKSKIREFSWLITKNHQQSMIIKSLTIQCFLIRCLTIRCLTMIQSLTSKMRFFELFIDNKNLKQQGLYLLEIWQNAIGSTDLATDRHGHDGPSWTSSSHTYAISSAVLLHYPRWQVWWTFIGTMFHRGSLFQNTSTLRIWVLGLLLSTSWLTCRTDRHRHDGPSQTL